MMKRPLNSIEKWIFATPILLALFYGGWRYWLSVRPFGVVNYADGWEVRDLAFSPDGKRLMIHAGLTQYKNKWIFDHQLEVRDVGSGEILTRCEIPSPVAQWVQHPAWSPDGKFLVDALGDNAGSTNSAVKVKSELVVWDAGNGHISQSLPFPQKSPDDFPESFYFLRDGRLVSVGNSVVLFDFPSLNERNRIVFKNVIETQVAFDRSQEHILVLPYSHYSNDFPSASRLKIWNTKTFRLIRALPNPLARDARWSQFNGNIALLQGSTASWPEYESGQLSILGENGKRLLWKAPFSDARILDWSPQSPCFALNRVSFSKKVNASVDKKSPAQFLRASSIEWWDGVQYKRLWSHPLSGWLEGLRVSSDGREIAGFENYARPLSGSTKRWTKFLCVWDAQTGALRLRREIDSYFCLKWAPTGAKLAFSDGATLQIIDFNSKK